MFLGIQTKTVNLNEPSSNSSSDSDSSSNSNSSYRSSSSRRSEPFGSDDSVVDPSYIPDLQDATANKNFFERVNIANKKRKVEHPSLNEKVGRKKIKRADTWTKAEAKKLRNSGERYTSKGIVKNQDGTKSKAIVVRQPKSLLPPCGDKCRLKCAEKIEEEQRTKIFREYWGLQDIEKKREFISSNMKSVNPRYKYSNRQEPRKPNNAFYFIIEGKNIRVCKFYFMATLAISHTAITTVLKKQLQCESGKVVDSDKRGLHKNHRKVSEDVKNTIRNHIRTIPRVESHYCRSHSSKEYIEGSKTIADLHRDYEESCKQQHVPAANYLMYTKIFNEEFNLAFHLPKKDQCELCLQYRASSNQEKLTIEEKFNKHVKEKELSRKEKENDKNSDGNTKVIVYDLQAVLPCPTGHASSFYYVSKLNVLNFTLYDIKTLEGTCYLWHEGEAQRGANEIGSYIFKFLQTISEQGEDDLKVVFYSDNCAGQNKNKFIIALYMYAVFSLGIKSITHKFFITGHGQSEGDTMHSVIEKQVKKFKKSSPIYSPEQYACIIRSAKKTGTPYKVNEMSFNDILDLKALAVDLFINIPKKVKLTDIRVLMVEKDHPNILFYKTSFAQNEFAEAEISSPRKKIYMGAIQLKKAYTKKNGISEAKKKGLLSLIEKKKCVPMYYLDFYNNL